MVGVLDGSQKDSLFCSVPDVRAAGFDISVFRSIHSYAIAASAKRHVIYKELSRRKMSRRSTRPGMEILCCCSLLLLD
jgi:hypothetical protein